MSASSLKLLALYLIVLVVLAWPLSRWVTAIAKGNLPRWATQIESAIYRLAGVRMEVSMSWTSYAYALLAFNAIGAIWVFAVQRLQSHLPFNPAKMSNVASDSAFNTAVSFVTNTNWQGYSGESTMSYLTQMLALTGQNFFSAATGMAVAFALIRGLSSHAKAGIGNFWVDITRITSFLLMPLSFVFALILVGQGVVQNFNPYQEIMTIDSVNYEIANTSADGHAILDAQGKPQMLAKKSTTQTLPMGPVASQEAIKMIGTNGGGIFNANSAHPYENPTALSNFLQMLAMLLIPTALCFSLGAMVSDRRQGFTILAAMAVMLVVAVLIATSAEQSGNPLLSSLGVDQSATAQQSGGNMEGKETRFGIDASSLFAVITTAASCGAVNSMHDSMTPLGGMMPLILIQLGEVVFGGVGSGLYGMLIFAILAVFIAGLLIGRTPEYLGKKIEPFEMKMTSIAILVTPIIVLVGTAVAVMTEAGRAGIANPGAHGFSEILYAFSSAANNNGSAFAGLSANTTFYNLALGISMWLGRFAVIVPILAIAGSLATKKRLPSGAGTLPTHGPLFCSLLIGTVVLVGLLNYVPALALGPGIEFFLMLSPR